MSKKDTKAEQPELSETQVRNLEVISKLQEKYPDAFVELDHLPLSSGKTLYLEPTENTYAYMVNEYTGILAIDDSVYEIEDHLVLDVIDPQFALLKAKINGFNGILDSNKVLKVSTKMMDGKSNVEVVIRPILYSDKVDLEIFGEAVVKVCEDKNAKKLYEESLKPNNIMEKIFPSSPSVAGAEVK